MPYIKKTKKGYNMGGNIYDEDYIGQLLADGGNVTDDDFAKKEKAKLESEKKEAARLAKEKEDADKKLSQKYAKDREIAKNLEFKKTLQESWKKDFEKKNNKYNALKDSYETFMKQSQEALKQPKRLGLPALVTKEGERKKQEKLLALLTEAENDLNKAKKLNDAAQVETNWNEDGTAKKTSASLAKAVITNPPVKTGAELEIPKFETTESPTTKKAVENKVASNIQRTGSPWAKSVGFTPDKTIEDNTEVIVPGTESNNINLGDPTDPRFKDNSAAGNLNTTQAEILNKTALNSENQTVPAEKTWRNQLKGVDWEMLGAGAQAALGAYYLNKSGKRPMYEMDPEFVKNVDLQKANAQYGYTSEQKALLGMENDAATRQGLEAARNYSGGSAANAYNKSRIVLNDSYGRNLQLEANDQQLKQDKQANVNNLIAQKAAMKNMMFQDQLNAWSANQTAGGNLMGAGIRNLINKSRLDKELAVQSQANSIVNNVN